MQPNLLVVFDLDGVLVETHHFHLEAWRQASIEVAGILVEDVLLDGIRGRSRQETINHLFGGEALPCEVQARLIARKAALYRASVMQDSSRLLVAGARELLRDLEAGGYAIALYSASSVAREVISAVGISSFFSYVSDGLDAGRPKPYPDRLVRMLAALGIAPGNAVLLEDSELGALAARVAGMRVLGIGSSLLQDCPTFARIDQLSAQAIRNYIIGDRHEQQSGEPCHLHSFISA
ncbi:HAD family hydrolase [Cupriavidus sp. RAF12]|uniref:HAD family hydrolase n=1 Tax=Cupriavidus sp. RAF12 TaxID=3233050 RepID=UPI003F93657F